MIKIMIAGRRRGGMTQAELFDYMLGQHGAMVVEHIRRDPARSPLRYVQNHVIDGIYRVPGAAPNPFALNRDFVTQVWFDSPAAAGAALASDAYKQEMQPDEDNFVDQSSVVKFPVVEHEVAGDPATRVEYKALLFLKRAPGVAADRFATAAQALARDAATLPQLARLVRCDAVHRPGEDGPIDCVLETWLPTRAEALTTLAALRECAFARLVPDALTTAASLVAVAAREHVLFAGAKGAA
jgi:vanillate O-demethylase ferredoxin subunit